jgi:hypothetical protein
VRKSVAKQGLSALSAFMAAWALFAAVDPAEASVTPVFSVNPGEINAGQQSTLDLTLTIAQDLSLCPDSDCGHVGASFLAFTGGSVTLNSGSGLSQTFTISLAQETVNNIGGGNFTISEDFQSLFSYPISGTYTPSYSFTLDYREDFVTLIPQLGAVDVPFDTTGTGQGTGSLKVDAVDTNPGTGNGPAATPLPATLPLFAGGLGFVGYLTRRKKQNLSALAAT